jgi:alcohol dehydrogenase
MLVKTVSSKKIDPTKLIIHHFPLQNIIQDYDTFQNAASDKTLKGILTYEQV